MGWLLTPYLIGPGFKGKLLDMEAALTKANRQLEDLYKFKGELLEAKEDKESERKEAIQRAVVLQSEIEASKRGRKRALFVNDS
jgi:hypothetical protein